MISRELLEAYAFSAPIVCAVVCMVMMLLDAAGYRRNAQEKQLRRFLALTYFVTSLGWLGMVLYVVAPRAFVYYLPMFLLTIMLEEVMFYRFVSQITGLGQPRHFSSLHLAIPLLIVVAATVSCLVIPIEQQAIAIYGETTADTNLWFKIMYTITTVIFIIYNSLYPILNLRNIRRYRLFVVNYSSDEQRISLHWLTVMQTLILVSVPFPLAGLLLGISTFSSSALVWLGALPSFMFYLILCYNMLDDNYLVIQPETIEEEHIGEEPTTALDRKGFSRYMREKKPYLNPKLRITDLAAGLHTNRTYLSAFINREYGMNFCRLINQCRLRALDRLRTAPENADKTNMELVLMAGFSGYRNYIRIKNEEDKQNLLKVFER